MGDDIDVITLYDDDISVADLQCSFTYFKDGDGDGFGDASNPSASCAAQPGYVLNDLDCDDNDPTVHPGAQGTQQGIDNDCNGVISADEALIPCPGDFNGDQTRNTADLLLFLGGIGCTSNCGLLDMNGDQSVDTADLLLFLSVIGTLCP